MKGTTALETLAAELGRDHTTSFEQITQIMTESNILVLNLIGINE
ncbi:hypothetical protein [Candidatus Albibeggiatoa sp. nov. NOAA]|nr:hypothetical protein [Thiotrichaceae bacterium]